MAESPQWMLPVGVGCIPLISPSGSVATCDQTSYTYVYAQYAYMLAKEIQRYVMFSILTICLKLNFRNLKVV